jgi:hypothetical protein
MRNPEFSVAWGREDQSGRQLVGFWRWCFSEVTAPVPRKCSAQSLAARRTTARVLLAVLAKRTFTTPTASTNEWSERLAFVVDILNGALAGNFTWRTGRTAPAPPQ